MFVLLFGTTGRLLFTAIYEFKTDSRTYATLFAASLGDFDLGIFKNEDLFVPERYGIIYMMLYLVISNIILLNFIIAVLSGVYDEVKDKGWLIYLTEIVKVRNMYIGNK
jgi:hypothetical protein